MPADGCLPVERADIPVSRRGSRHVRLIVVGNEKGGAGKSTVSIHLTIALLRAGLKVGVIDLDVRQRSLTRYLENRARWMQATGGSLPMPDMARVEASRERDLDRAEAEETARFSAGIDRLNGSCDIIIIDAPGGDTCLSRLAHRYADTLITPLNDSFVDFDLLGDVNPQTLEVIRPSFYAEMVWECRKAKAQSSRRPIDWVVMRNRMSAISARNKERVGGALENLAKRIGFRLAPGLTERVIYRELFPAGLTILDLTEQSTNVTFSMSHAAARQELRDLLIVLQLPELTGVELSF